MGTDADARTGSTLLVLLKDPADAHAWGAFVRRYGPRIHAWCRQWHLQEADADNVTQDVLLRLVRKLRSFRYDPARGMFRGWLKTVARHAWADYLESQQRAGVGAGDSAVLEQLEGLEAREGLLTSLEEAFDLELLEEARARVRLQVSARDWQIFQDLAVASRAGPDVARDLGMNVAAVLMAKSRVQKKLRAEIRRLEGAGPQAPEERP